MAFAHAHHFSIGSATFHTTPTTNNFYSWPPSASPVEILRQARATEATHTSSTSSYAPKCNPATRQKVIADITDWVGGSAGSDSNESPAPRPSILWFSGPAGGGKTCIMREVVDRCIEASGLTAVSYFFSARGSGLSSERPFVATIVHQLTTLHPDLRSIIYDTIQDYPTIFEESQEFQMAKLVVEPLESHASRTQAPSPRKIIIAIDGFDECGGERERQHLLHILRDLVNKIPKLVVVVLASRPEYDIRREFDNPNLKSITKFLRLQDYDGTEDIHIYLCDEFEAIRQTHLLKNFIPKNWPFEETIRLLLDKSSGNFIYPATIIKYINRSRRSPVDALNDVLALSKASPSGTNPLAELDALYSLILHPPDTDLILMKRLLHCLLGIKATSKYRSASFLDKLLGLPPHTTITTFCDLHSILSIPDVEDQPIQLHHKSLEDYLSSPERSMDFFQSAYETHLDLTMVCAKRIQRWGRYPVLDRSEQLYYSSFYWEHNLSLCINNKPSSVTLPDSIMLDTSVPRNILKYRFVHRLDPFICNNIRISVHWAFCSEQCVTLCRLFTHINECWPKIMAFDAKFYQDDLEKRVKALSRFQSETGLDTPLDPLISDHGVTSPTMVIDVKPDSAPVMPLDGLSRFRRASPSDLDRSSPGSERRSTSYLKRGRYSPYLVQRSKR